MPVLPNPLTIDDIPTTTDTKIESGVELGLSYVPDFLDFPFSRPIACFKTEHAYEVIMELFTTPRACPRCGRPPAELRPNGTLVHKIIDQLLHGLYVYLYFVRQRYKCPCGRSLLQPLAGVVNGKSITQRAAADIAQACLTQSFELVAAERGISPKTAKHLFTDYVVALEGARQIECPEILGIDGVCVGRYKNKRSYCLLTDLSRHGILDLLPKTTELELARFLKQVPNPEKLRVVVIDMSKGFLYVIQKLFPHVIVVIDNYHVLRLLNDAITAVVRMRQKNLTNAENDKLMAGGNRFLLLKRRFDLTEEENEQLAHWFERVPEFKQAYDLKEEIYDVWRSTERRYAEERYDAWLKKLPKDLEESFSKFTGAIKRWRPFIFNFFDHKVTNAYTESRNRDIKSLQRLGRRTSFSVLRARLLYSDLLHKPLSNGSALETRRVRRALKAAKESRRTGPLTRDPRSYLARLEAVRKSRNEFSKLLRPPQEWEERFSHYSCYSEEESPRKWDFIW